MDDLGDCGTCTCIGSSTYIISFHLYIFGVFCNLSWSVLKCVDLDGPENTPAPNTTLPAAFDVLKWRMIVNGCRDSLLFFSSPFFLLYFVFWD